ncbi:CLUMA_CG013940, isoform A [Clunio marinus]|uniref:CLUMA_CG013940, isoform A n=1 Tax=Clunio marinus TaxID=568069 RepID=A0A1J1IKH5_9DIPT|nr:CLUMA_CG013940, isoform A [Clunio marinus]
MSTQLSLKCFKTTKTMQKTVDGIFLYVSSNMFVRENVKKISISIFMKISFSAAEISPKICGRIAKKILPLIKIVLLTTKSENLRKFFTFVLRMKSERNPVEF